MIILRPFTFTRIAEDPALGPFVLSNGETTLTIEVTDLGGGSYQIDWDIPAQTAGRYAIFYRWESDAATPVNPTFYIVNNNAVSTAKSGSYTTAKIYARFALVVADAGSNANQRDIFVPDNGTSFIDQTANEGDWDIIGMNTIGGSQVSLGTDKAWFQKFTMPTDGDMYALRLYCSLSSGSGNVKGLLYNHNSGTDKPSTLIDTATPRALTGDGTFRWYDMVFSTPVSLTSGSTYWMGFTPDTSINTKYGGSGYRVAWNTNVTDYDSPADNPSSGTYLNNNGLSVFGTYAHA
jgi:hypothetical protein